jgi:hypothetical protein
MRSLGKLISFLQRPEDMVLGGFVHIRRSKPAHINPSYNLATFGFILKSIPSYWLSLLNTSSYLVNYKQSAALRDLRVDHCYLTGESVAFLLRSMTERPGKARNIHFDISENYIEQGLRKLTDAIAEGIAPSHLTIRLIEFEREEDFRQLISAFARNNTIEHLDISRASLPSDASEETCLALERMFSDNKTLEWLDMSGEDSRLETTKLGVGINRALRGLQRNHTLRVLLIKCEYSPQRAC